MIEKRKCRYCGDPTGVTVSYQPRGKRIKAKRTPWVYVCQKIECMDRWFTEVHRDQD